MNAEPEPFEVWAAPHVFTIHRIGLYLWGGDVLSDPGRPDHYTGSGINEGAPAAKLAFDYMPVLTIGRLLVAVVAAMKPLRREPLHERATLRSTTYGSASLHRSPEAPRRV